MNKAKYLALVVVSLLPATSLAKTAKQICDLVAKGKTLKNVEVVKTLVGDGKTDNYRAFKDLANSLTDSTDRILIFPRGTYLIDQVKDSCDPRNRTSNITIRNASRFRLIGCNARIEVKGDFRMDGCLSAVVPLEVKNSSQFSIEGFELNGNVNRMSRNLDIESGSSGIVTSNSSHYSLVNLYVHHFSLDGIYLGRGIGDNGEHKADRFVRINQVVSSNNARQGLSVIQARDVLISNSRFSDNGRTGSKFFPGLAPMTGLDIEPNWSPYDSDPTKRIDVATGRIFVRNTFMENNLGSQFRAQTGARQTRSRVDTVLIGDNSRLTSAPDSDPIAAILSVTGGRITKSLINTRGGTFYAFWGSENNRPLVDTNRSLCHLGCAHGTRLRRSEKAQRRVER